MAVNVRLILGSVLGCAVAYSGYSYIERKNHIDDLEKNAKIRPVAGTLEKGLIVPVKKGKFVKNEKGKMQFVADPVQPNVGASPASQATATPVPPVAVPSQPPPTTARIATAPLSGSTPASTPASIPAPVAATPPLIPASAANAAVQKSAATPVSPVMPAIPVTPAAAPPVPPAVQAKVEPLAPSCNWKAGGSFANIRYGQSLFRFNLRPDLDAKSPLLVHFEGRAKPTVVGDEEKSVCTAGDCFVISSELVASFTSDGLHDYKCGDWYLVTDGTAEGCTTQKLAHALKISKSVAGKCVVGSLVDVRTTGSANAKSKVQLSSMFVTGTKPESLKSTGEGKAENE